MRKKTNKQTNKIHLLIYSRYRCEDRRAGSSETYSSRWQVDWITSRWIHHEDVGLLEAVLMKHFLLIKMCGGVYVYVLLLLSFHYTHQMSKLTGWEGANSNDLWPYRTCSTGIQISHLFSLFFSRENECFSLAFSLNKHQNERKLVISVCMRHSLIKSPNKYPEKVNSNHLRSNDLLSWKRIFHIHRRVSTSEKKTLCGSSIRINRSSYVLSLWPKIIIIIMIIIIHLHSAELRSIWKVCLVISLSAQLRYPHLTDPTDLLPWSLRCPTTTDFLGARYRTELADGPH